MLLINLISMNALISKITIEKAFKLIYDLPKGLHAVTKTILHVVSSRKGNKFVKVAQYSFQHLYLDGSL